MANTVADFTAFQKPTADELDYIVPRCAVLAAAHILDASSTTLQNITGMSLPVVAGSYAWDLMVPYEQADNDPDVKFALTFPTASTASYAVRHLVSTTTGAGPYSINMAGGSLTSGTAFAIGGTVGLRATFEAYGHFVFTADGTVQLQAAENTSDVNAPTLHPGTRLVLIRAA